MSIHVTSERWNQVLEASQRLKRIERQLANLAADIDSQLGDDPEGFFILGESATDDQKQALRHVLTLIKSIMA